MTKKSKYTKAEVQAHFKRGVEAYRSYKKKKPSGKKKIGHFIKKAFGK